MNQSTAMKTATAAGAAAIVTPVVAWVAGLCHVQMPPEVLSSIVVMVVTGAHWLGDYLSQRAAQAASTQGTSQ
jgi:hypothetical protein